MTKKPTVNSPHAKALEAPQHRHQVIPNKRHRERDPDEVCGVCKEEWLDCECSIDCGGSHRDDGRGTCIDCGIAIPGSKYA